ncbi:MAG: PDZ domain-containing protein [Krumholzibacteria bacterium]|nr:PDZ domain-containing protein [Candidatus Krumholzibacteria bacterium]
MPRRIALTVLLLALAGCGNPYRDHFESTLERWPSGEASRLLPPSEPVEIVTSQDMRGDAVRMLENGYLLLGRSRFSGSNVDPGGARKQAEQIGAAAVLVASKYADSVTRTVPISEYIPPREERYTESGYVQVSPDSGYWYDREMTRTIAGEFRTAYVPQTTDYYEYAATYWAKSKPPVFGVLVRELSAEQRRELQSNRGVLVRAVIKGSPAFLADFLRDDVITSFAGEVVYERDRFFELVAANQGKEVTVELVRLGEPRTVTVRLRRDE